MARLESGQTLLHYRVVEKIGSGGMGEVWIADDTRLQRRVALKVLPPGAEGNERARARFEREALAVASLNHPHIVTIHAVEEADGVLFLAMELIEGKALTPQLQSVMPLDRIFELAIPLTDAIAAAHERGILHRDLKPENVMVTTDGVLKVLDFGVAKLREQATGQPGADTTREGEIVGTAAYMSPEQAEGLAVVPASDVFALGIILYQMATGCRPFSGATPVSLVSSILKDRPRPVTDLNRDTPRHLGRIVRRCLEKDPARRYTTARELHNELLLLKEELAAGVDTETAAPRGVSPVAIVTVGVVLAGLTIFAAFGWLRSPPDRGFAAGARVSQQTLFSGVETNPSLSPDGQFMAYEAVSEDGDSDVFLLRIDGRNPINLTEDSAAFDGQPAFAPDGSHIAFRSNRDGGGLFVMGATGESVRRVTDFGFDPAWAPDGRRIVFATEGVGSPLARQGRSELWVFDFDAGETRKIFDGDAVQPAWSPRDKRIAFWTANAATAVAGQRDLGTIRVDGSDPVLITADPPVDWRPVWSPSGKQLYFASDRGGSMNLWRIGVDEDTGLSHGEATPVTTPSLWSGAFALSADGARIAYVAQDERSGLVGVDFDPETGTTHGEQRTVTRGALIVSNWEMSPNGEWIAMTNRGQQEDLFLVRPDGRGLRKLTDDLHKDRGVTWLDDDRLAFYSSRSGGYEVWTMRRDGSDLHQVTETSGLSLWMPQVSSDGSRMIAHNSEGTYLWELGGQVPLRKETALHLERIEGGEMTFRGFFWSPDGTRILGTAVAPLKTVVAVYDLRDRSYRLFDTPRGTIAAAGDWLPDGRRFVASAGEAAWVVDGDSGSWRELPIELNGGTARLTPDGRMLHYAETTTEADIWVSWIE